MECERHANGNHPVFQDFFSYKKIKARNVYLFAASTGRTDEFIIWEMSYGMPGSCDTESTWAFSLLTEM